TVRTRRESAATLLPKRTRTKRRFPAAEDQRSKVTLAGASLIAHLPPSACLARSCLGGEPVKHRLECRRMGGEKPNEAAAQSGAPRDRQHRPRRPSVAPKQAGEGAGVGDERISSCSSSEGVGKDLA